MFRAYRTSAAPALHPRTIAALSAALFVVAGAGFMLGPDLRAGWAQSDESSAAYWRAERARQNGAHAAARAHEADSGRMPTRVAAYAPPPRQFFSGLHVPSIFRSTPQPARDGYALDRTARGQKTATSGKPTTGNPAARGKSASGKKPDRPVIANAASAVCVRLCDGFHFPAGDQGAGPAALEASCNSMCPGAPTRVYYSRSERIEDAVAMRTGRSYRTLPVALRYASTRDSTCTCRTDGSPGLPTVDINRDPTLRRGDPVMTETGFRIFRGAARMPYRPRDFTSLADSRGVTPVSHTILVAMERASGIRPQRRPPAVNARAGLPRELEAAGGQKNAELMPVSPFVPIPSLNPKPPGVVRLIGPQALYTR